MIKLLIAVSLLQLTVPGQSNITITGLLPDSVSGWQKESPSEIFAGEDLYRLIDGGADIFFEYGFNQVITGRYRNNNDKVITAEIYEMRDSSSAFGIFSLSAFKTGKLTDFSSGASVGDEFLIFYKGTYYITITGYEISEEIREGIFLIAESIDAELKENEKPPLVKIFDESGDYKIVYMKGNLALYNLDYFNFIKNLELKEAVLLEENKSSTLVINSLNKTEAEKKFLILENDLPSNEPDTAKISAEEKYNYVIFREKKGYILIGLYDRYIFVNSSSDGSCGFNSLERIRDLLSRFRE